MAYGNVKRTSSIFFFKESLYFNVPDLKKLAHKVIGSSLLLICPSKAKTIDQH